MFSEAYCNIGQIECLSSLVIGDSNELKWFQLGQCTTAEYVKAFNGAIYDFSVMCLEEIKFQFRVQLSGNSIPCISPRESFVIILCKDGVLI